MTANDRREASRRAERRIERRHVIIAGIGALAVMVVVAVSFAVVPAIRAARSQGARGTFVAASMVCIRTGCNWVGTFEYPSGEQVPGVAYYGSMPGGTHAGTAVPALYPGGNHAVFPPRGSRYWVEDVLVVLFLGGVVALTLWISPVGLGRRRRPV